MPRRQVQRRSNKRRTRSSELSPLPAKFSRCRVDRFSQLLPACDPCRFSCETRIGKITRQSFASNHIRWFVVISTLGGGEQRFRFGSTRISVRASPESGISIRRSYGMTSSSAVLVTTGSGLPPGRKAIVAGISTRIIGVGESCPRPCCCGWNGTLQHTIRLGLSQIVFTTMLDAYVCSKGCNSNRSTWGSSNAS